MTEKTIVVKDLHDQYLKAFKEGNDVLFDQLDGYINEIYSDLFKNLISGKIDCAYFDNHKAANGMYTRYVYHRSVRHSGLQKSCMLMYPDGKFEPVSHRDYVTLGDLLKDLPESGIEIHCRTY